MAKSDPIRERYFKSVERADSATDSFFYLGAVLSFVTLFVDRQRSPEIYQWTLAAFVLIVASYFVIGLVARLYFTPRAEHKRREDFLSEAFGVSLTAENAEGYYNNEFKEPDKKLAAQTLENSFFTKALLLRVAQRERVKTLGYFALWLILAVNRTTDIGVILAATQAVFSEQVLSKLVRVEWLRARCEKVYDDVYRLFQSKVSAERFLPLALDSLLLYETAKSNAAVVISSKLFEKLNDELSNEWKGVRTKLDL
jgi:hypothetical protein